MKVITRIYKFNEKIPRDGFTKIIDDAPKIFKVHNDFLQPWGYNCILDIMFPQTYELSDKVGFMYDEGYELDKTEEAFIDYVIDMIRFRYNAETVSRIDMICDRKSNKLFDTNSLTTKKSKDFIDKCCEKIIYHAFNDFNIPCTKRKEKR